MEKFIIKGGHQLNGKITVGGAKNVSLKALVAACLTEDEVVIHNIPLISDFLIMAEIIRDLGGEVEISGHTARVRVTEFKKHSITLEQASHVRTSAMFIAPLLARYNEAIIPNPGGCRLGARPIDRLINGIKEMNVAITYHSEDGYFHAQTKGLSAVTYTFEKNTHMGTETLILTSVLAKGTTVLKNAAEEPEIDDLILFLNSMGAKVRRSGKREITIVGVKKLHGTEFTISPDRNEIITFAIAAIVTKGSIFIPDANSVDLNGFIEKLKEAGGGIEIKNNGISFFYKQPLHAVNIETKIYPGFMTDWQAPWAVMMTQAEGISIVHETVFENKLGYVRELRKMGAKIRFFNPQIENPAEFYNFNPEDDKPSYYHAIKITGPTVLHNAVINMVDLRAGAAVVLAALIAKGETVIHGVYLVDRGYENLEGRLQSLGADIKRVNE